MSNSVIENTYKLAYNYIINKDHGVDIEKLISALDALIGVKIEVTSQITIIDGYSGMEYHTVQNALATINEKESVRKDKGVYYTPKDVVDFILINCTKALYKQINHEKMHDCDLSNIPVEDFCKNKRILEPTCGAGEFMLTALITKLKLWIEYKKSISNKDVKEIVSTIYGNDINPESVIITKVRLFLAILNMCGGSSAVAATSQLNSAFSSVDFVELPKNFNRKFDMIVGNPPYVEDNKYGELSNKYGNIYCNVLINSANLLNPDGAIGFIIPISYSTTPRMSKIRKELLEKVQTQYILSYADRPSCLFTSVHQKLCILIANSSKEQPCIYTSNYKYWYKEEREGLFDEVSVIENRHCCESFIPKLGNTIELSIYEKIQKQSKSINDYVREDGTPVFLNMRACFWIKAFLSPKSSSEYKTFYFEDMTANYIYCLLNSSLFWWYWICVSDCWHLTQKNISSFSIPQVNEYQKFFRLATALESRLEETKKYIGSVQTDYEYKHKSCIKEIHDIDDYICKLYNLSESETEYIKQFGYKYRTSTGCVEAIK